MFQFRRFPTYTYLIQCTLHGYCPCGLPHSEISGSMDICSSPKLIAACHVLHRLLMPRHSPCALSSLTNRRRNSLHSVSGFAENFLSAPSFSSSSRTHFIGLREAFLVLLNYAGFTKILEIVIVTLIFPDVVPQLKFCFPRFRAETSLLPYFTCFSSHCSVFKVQASSLF